MSGKKTENDQILSLSSHIPSFLALVFLCICSCMFDHRYRVRSIPGKIVRPGPNWLGLFILGFWRSTFAFGSHNMWIWFSQLQAQIILYFDLAGKIFRSKNHLEKVDELALNEFHVMEEVLNDSGPPQNDETLKFHVSDFKVSGSRVYREALQFLSLLSDVSQKFMLPYSDSILKFRNIVQTKDTPNGCNSENTEKTPTEQCQDAIPISPVDPSDPALSLMSSVWSPPLPGTTSAPTRSTAVSELRLAFQCLPHQFSTHLTLCSTLLEHQSYLTSSSFEIKKIFFINKPLYKKFEHDIFVMMSTLILSSICLRVPSNLRVVPHKTPKEQQLDLKLIESLDVMSSFSFLKILENEKVSLVTAIETALWHLKFCRIMATCIDGSITSKAFTPPCMNKSKKNLSSQMEDENGGGTTPLPLPSSSPSSNLRNRHHHRSSSRETKHRIKSEVGQVHDSHKGKVKEEVRSSSLVDDEDDPELKANHKQNIQFSYEIESKLKDISSFNIHVDRAVEIIMSSLLNDISQTTINHFEEYDKVKTAVLRRLFSSSRHIEVLDKAIINNDDDDDDDDVYSFSSYGDDDPPISLRKTIDEETLSNGYISIRAIVSVFMQLMLRPTSWCFNSSTRFKDGMALAKVKKILTDLSDQNRSPLEILNSIFHHHHQHQQQQQQQQPHRVSRNDDEHSNNGDAVLLELIMVLDVLKLNRKLLMNLEQLIISLSKEKHVLYNDTSSSQNNSIIEEKLSEKQSNSEDKMIWLTHHHKKDTVYLESLEHTWCDSIIDGMAPWLTQEQTENKIHFQQMSPFSTALSNWHIENAKQFVESEKTLSASSFINKEEEVVDDMGNKTVENNEITQSSIENEHVGDFNLNQHLTNLRSLDKQTNKLSLSQNKTLFLPSVSYKKIEINDIELIKLTKKSIKSTLGTTRSLENGGKWTIPKLDDAMEKLLQSVSYQKLMDHHYHPQHHPHHSQANHQHTIQQSYDVIKINDRIKDNMKIQIMLMKALRSCLSSRVVFNSHTIDRQQKYDDIGKEEEDEVFNHYENEYNNWNMPNDGDNVSKKKSENLIINYGSALSSSLIRRLTSVAVRCIRNHCLRTKKVDHEKNTSSVYQGIIIDDDELPILIQGPESAELLRFSCQLLNELTKTPSTDLLTSTSNLNQPHSTTNMDNSSPYTETNHQHEEDLQMITPYARGSRARLAARAASKQAKVDNDAILAVTPASKNYASVAASGGFAALADAMIAVDKASINLCKLNDNENDENNILFDYMNMKKQYEKTDDGHHTEEEEEYGKEVKNMEDLLDDFAEIRRAGLSVFARHDILDTYGLRRFGGRRSLIGCFAAMKWTTREKWRNALNWKNIDKSSNNVPTMSDNKSEGLTMRDAEGLAGLSLIATTHLLLRIAATDMLPLHVAVQEGDVARIKAEITLRTAKKWSNDKEEDDKNLIGVQGSSLKFLDTAHWFFLEQNGLAHIKDAAGLHGGFRGIPPGNISTSVVAAAGQWAMKTLGEHWPEFLDDNKLISSSFSAKNADKTKYVGFDSPNSAQHDRDEGDELHEDF